MFVFVFTSCLSSPIFCSNKTKNLFKSSSISMTSFEFIKRAKKNAKPLFIPKCEEEDYKRPVIRHKGLLSFLSDVILGNFTDDSKDKDNSIKFEVTHLNNEMLSEKVKRINANFYANILNKFDKVFVHNTNQSTVQIDEMESNNSEININVKQGLYIDVKEEHVIGILSEAYDAQKEKLVNEIKSLFENKTVNELKQHLQSEEKRGLITQLANALGASDSSAKVGQIAKSQDLTKNLLDQIYEQFEETKSEESFKQIFLGSYKAKLDEINEIYLKKYKAVDSHLNININQDFQLMFQKLSKQNIVHSIYADINNTKIFRVAEKTLNTIKESGDEYLKNKTADEGVAAN